MVQLRAFFGADFCSCEIPLSLTTQAHKDGQTLDKNRNMTKHKMVEEQRDLIFVSIELTPFSCCRVTLNLRAAKIN